MKIVNLNEAYLTENSWYQVDYLDSSKNPCVGYAHLNNLNPAGSMAQLFHDITARHATGLSNTYKNFTSFNNSKNYIDCTLVRVTPVAAVPTGAPIITDMERSLRKEANDSPSAQAILTACVYTSNQDKLVHHLNYDETDNSINNLAIIINSYGLPSNEMNHFHYALHAIQDVLGMGSIVPGSRVSIPVLTAAGAHTLNLEIV